MRKNLSCLLLACLCPLFALAQDVIVKKDGNAVICRIVEVGKTEVVYKRWANLQGSNYVMNISDITSIQYESGEKKVFDVAHPTPANAQPSVMQNRQIGELDDAEFLNYAKMNYRIKYPMRMERLKRTAWIAGPIVFTFGTAVVALSLYQRNGLWVIGGSALAVGGIATTTGCLVKAHKLSKYNVQSTPVYGREFLLKNGSSLSTDICSLTDGRSLPPALGVGLNYNF